jgi:hypothetical protein
MTARRMVIAFAAVSGLGLLLGLSGVTHLPSARYVAADVVLEALVVVGLWFLWRPAWLFAAVVTALGELLLIVHPARNAAILMIGAAQLALLASLRESVARRSL